MKTSRPAGLLLLLCLSGCPTGAPTTTTTPAQSADAAAPIVADTPTSTLADSEWVVTAQNFGPITAQSTQASLEEHFGKEHVKAGDIPGAEGIMQPGLQIFAEQPDKTVSVFFTETEPKRVSSAQVHGDSSQWKTSHGITLGTSLSDLEKANGKPFELTGFGWDYGGFVTEWKDGALEGLIVRLNATADGLSEEEQASISGDQIVASDLAALKKAQPKVSQISVVFATEPTSPTPSATEEG